MLRWSQFHCPGAASGIGTTHKHCLQKAWRKLNPANCQNNKWKKRKTNSNDLLHLSTPSQTTEPCPHLIKKAPKKASKLTFSWPSFVKRLFSRLRLSFSCWSQHGNKVPKEPQYGWKHCSCWGDRSADQWYSSKLLKKKISGLYWLVSTAHWKSIL